MVETMQLESAESKAESSKLKEEGLED